MVLPITKKIVKVTKKIVEVAKKIVMLKLIIDLSTAIRTGILSCREGNGKEDHASTVSLFPHVPV